MSLQPTRVTARWHLDGRFEPRRFTWQEHPVDVESTGRQWEDADGLHVLCMNHSGQVFELVFRLNPAGWWVRPPANLPGRV
jgi:hypothetical protein